MKIQVMGPGCPKCDEAEKTVRDAVAEAGIVAEIVKVKDFQEIAKYGIFSTPAVVIDDEVKVVGKAPSKKEVLSWIS
ncbi:thioredoxin family protein [Pseudodesulfovibrio sp. zrk46]|uniref:thioredoxin family protein n=1 Tax=Pseudodesulfovibrio sp. zrk46 TaxID=2725288 RepID=UPI001448AA01|nr:thioredoxin family protein [Pseudodesulfovibrio sp. zrk46]QJB55451.1 thioredoxin family protein [Pseudodesulfovibrio sp. zrk46]